MKRIVMMLLFALVIPSVGFAEICLSIEELKGKNIEELVTLKNEASNQLIKEIKNKNPELKKREIEAISKCIDNISKILSEKEFKEGYDKAKSEDKNSEKYRTWRGGVHFPYFIGGYNRALQLGGQLEPPPPRFFIFDDYLPSFISGKLPKSDLSFRFFYTYSGDEWIMSDSVTQTKTTINIHTIGVSPILKFYTNSERTFWLSIIGGVNYNFIKPDNEIISPNASKDFNNDKLGFHGGLGVGFRFSKFLGFDTESSIFIEYNHKFIRLGASEQGKIFGKSLTTDADESLHYNSVILGLDFIF